MSSPLVLTPLIPQKSPKYTWPLILIAPFLFVLLSSNIGWATSCSTISLSLGGASVTCNIPEKTPEVSVVATLSNLSFTAQAQGMVLIYDDAAQTILSDVVTFTDVAGVATVTFVSDTDLSTITASGLPILGQFTENHKPIILSLALGNNDFLRVKICSDVNEKTGCKKSSDSISLSERSSGTVPEPGTFILLGSGLLGSAWQRRRLFKGMRS